MNSSRIARYFEGALLTLSLAIIPTPAAGVGDAVDKRAQPDPVPWMGPVPKANCGPWDWAESGLQGQTTLDERYSGDSAGGYNCNLEFVGQYQGEGAKSWMMAWIDDCAYYPTNKNPMQQNLGVVVVDASDSRRPQVSGYLTSPAMLDPHESLKVNDRRKILAGVENTSFTIPVPSSMGFAIYDVSTDCRHPTLLSSIYIPNSMGHAGNFTPDGRTYYGTHTLEIGMTAIDVSDPTQPQTLGFIEQLVHDVSFSKDGTRAYVAQIGHFPPIYPVLTGPNGLVIMDVSEFQLRRPNPQARVISRLYWEDGGGAQQTLPVTFNGRPHLIFTDEGGSDAAGIAASCARGLPPYGFARIIDITDETRPRIISKLMLEVHDPANCPLMVNDPPDVGSSLNYSSHYCNVDSVSNPTMLACSYRHAGIRVFDIRDPYRPREIAYYKPPAMRTAFLPGSNYWVAGRDRTVEHTASMVRFRKVPADETHGRQMEIWFTSSDNSFQIVRFSSDMTGREKELLEKATRADDE